MQQDVYLYDAVRSPRGKGRADGALAGILPQELVAQLIHALVARNGAQARDQFGALTLGCVGQVGAQGGHIGLVSRVHAGMPDSVRAVTLNNFCASGLTAIRIAVQAAREDGNDELHLAGGVEMMSAVPFLGDGALYYEDKAISDPLQWVPVGLSADLMATMDGISASDLNAAAIRSHDRAAAAWANGTLSEVIPVRDAGGDIALDRDESVRPGSTQEKLSRMPPVFAATGAAGYDALILSRVPGLSEVAHLHTAATCPPIADGAALVLLGSQAAGEAAGLTPRARVVAVAEAAASPLLQLTAGFAAMRKVLAMSGMSLRQFDRIEFMEAFAATIVKFERDFSPDMSRVNPEGGHLAMGHPMGATGGVLAATLLAGLERQGGRFGLVVATGGSGVGAAMIIERVG